MSINKNSPADRKRFTMAHELGHIVMHVNSSIAFDFDINIEEEAFKFAAELLMPQNEIYPSVSGNLTIAKLADLKRYWRVSMQAILYWAQKMGAVTYNHARYLWTQFNSLRIRIKEPVEIAPEKPSFLFDVINAYINRLNYSKDQLRDMLSLNEREFEEKYLPSGGTIRIVR